VALELADIFQEFGAAYRQKHTRRILPSHRQAMRAIERCRTEALGGQVYVCAACDEKRYSYHSCRNRHCPKCQHKQTEEWLVLQRKLLLPASYFLLTFTIPAELRQIARQNQKVIYNLLFRTSAKATQSLARDTRFIGGQIGLVGILHTWTRKLAFHPHVHYLAPGGGLAPDGHTWLPANKKFFLPVKALSRSFRAAFQHALQKTELYSLIPSSIWYKEWVVNCKVVGDGQAALKYLAPYIHRVAISNRRLISLSSGSLESAQVTFSYRSSKTRKTKCFSLSVEKFMHSFLQHVLPRGFVKVRYYGFFGARVRSKLILLQQAMDTSPSPQPQDKLDGKPEEAEDEQGMICAKCGHPMTFQRTIHPLKCRSP